MTGVAELAPAVFACFLTGVLMVMSWKPGPDPAPLSDVSRDLGEVVSWSKIESPLD